MLPFGGVPHAVGRQPPRAPGGSCALTPRAVGWGAGVCPLPQIPVLACNSPVPAGGSLGGCPSTASLGYVLCVSWGFRLRLKPRLSHNLSHRLEPPFTHPPSLVARAIRAPRLGPVRRIFALRDASVVAPLWARPLYERAGRLSSGPLLFQSFLPPPTQHASGAGGARPVLTRPGG